ncbi:2-succinyl-6-hydroxy-2,4-cyclohexadiene-1-carboxylate synthase [Sodalis sp. RH24]|uniref:2-succinyl-6-hydroxy-2, 4-cyclohexadiene-1-carboxylate synthase n=1 Tax=unclassified Sodalis (in: enterobacteria) TaxID=2636512 RepID=UPI0039B3CF8A
MNRHAPLPPAAIGIPVGPGKGAGWTVSRLRRGDPCRPWLVWLHGLLGSGDDWSPVLPYFSDWSLATLNLPGHGPDAGAARAPACALHREQAADGGAPRQTAGLDFAAVSAGLAHTLAALGITRYILIGYSLGGRIALYHACRGRCGAGNIPGAAGANGQEGLCGLFVEGAHPGLAHRRERADRLRHDGLWARRFSRQPITAVLADWYRQPVFGDLSDDARRQLVALRAANDGAAVAAMLLATSLARQPDLAARLRALDLPFGYLCGEHDGKFTALARGAALPLVPVPGAGHNAHRANPPAFAGQLLTLLAPFH